MHLNLPDDFSLCDLTAEEQDVLRYAYGRSKDAEKPRRLRSFSDGVFFFFPASPEQRAEKRLFDLGLLARTYSNREGGYGYAISLDGYEWYERALATTNAHRD